MKVRPISSLSFVTFFIFSYVGFGHAQAFAQSVGVPSVTTVYVGGDPQHLLQHDILDRHLAQIRETFTRITGGDTTIRVTTNNFSASPAVIERDETVVENGRVIASQQRSYDPKSFMGTSIDLAEGSSEPGLRSSAFGSATTISGNVPSKVMERLRSETAPGESILSVTVDTVAHSTTALVLKVVSPNGKLNIPAGQLAYRPVHTLGTTTGEAVVGPDGTRTWYRTYKDGARLPVQVQSADSTDLTVYEYNDAGKLQYSTHEHFTPDHRISENVRFDREGHEIERHTYSYDTLGHPVFERHQVAGRDYETTKREYIYAN